MSRYRLFHRLRRADHGTASLELALIAPVMGLFLMGTYEGASGVRASNKVYAASAAMADLVARQSTVTPGNIQDFCNGARGVVAPLTPANVLITVAEVTQTSSGPTVVWTDTSSCGGSAISSAVAHATPFIPVTNDSVIVVQATYSYQSTIAYTPLSTVLPGSFALVGTSYVRPRYSAGVCYNTTCPPLSG